ncbi:MAG: hypothetical protein JW954_08645 [Dehalococcoidaceae bacterium]|nr:hypothetical protein [Dehalococcoidaceae bacterium]
MKRPDLLILVAVWQFFTGTIAFFGIMAIVFIALPVVLGISDIWSGNWGHWNGWEYSPGLAAPIIGLSIAVVVLLAYFIISLAAGIGTLQGKPWARLLGIVHAVMGVVNFPLGTVIGVLIIIYLGNQEVRDYFEASRLP